MPIDRIPPRESIQVNPAVVSYGIPINEPTCRGVVVAVTQKQEAGSRIRRCVGLCLPLREVTPLTTEAYRVAVRASQLICFLLYR
jgi:hypothetical protein